MTGNAEGDQSEADVGGTAMVHQVTVPPSARERSTLARVDYEDAFLVEAEDARRWTGERWARAVLEGAPETVRRRLIRGWHSLGLQVDPTRSEGFVLGWEVRHSSPDVALLGSAGRLGMSGELLFGTQGDTLLFATFVQLDNPVARLMWRSLATRHRSVVRQLLVRAATQRRSDQ